MFGVPLLGRVLISKEHYLSRCRTIAGHEKPRKLGSNRHSSRRIQASRCDIISPITVTIDAFPEVISFARFLFLFFLVALAFRIGRVRCRLWGGIEGTATPVRMLVPLLSTFFNTTAQPRWTSRLARIGGLLSQDPQIRSRSLEASSILREFWRRGGMKGGREECDRDGLYEAL